MRQRLQLAGKVALVTGAAQGIGVEMARQLYRRGAQVALVDRDGDRLTEATRTFGPGPEPLTITADVRDRAAMAAAIDRVVETLGRLDVVIANAGITPPPATVATVDLDDFDRVMAVNFTGALNTVHPALEQITRNRGHVVVVSSSAAYCPGIGGAAYMSSKAAAEQLGRTLRLELAPHGATGSVAYFGFVDTELARNTLDRDPLGARVGRLLPWPLNRRVTAEHAADVVIRGIERRAPRITTPRVWAGYSVLRGVINPLIDRMLIGNPEVHALLDALEQRTADSGPITSTSPTQRPAPARQHPE
jgi:NAD(P)-dependent dehydrogenase (short-subunit alcohol dehydrogenase family)